MSLLTTSQRKEKKRFNHDPCTIHKTSLSDHANDINFLWGIVGSKGRDLPATSPFSREHYVQSIS
jgi:hypothetical protein